MTYVGQGVYRNDAVADNSARIRVRHRRPRIVDAIVDYMRQSADDVRRADAWAERAEAARILRSAS